MQQIRFGDGQKGAFELERKRDKSPLKLLVRGTRVGQISLVELSKYCSGS